MEYIIVLEMQNKTKLDEIALRHKDIQDRLIRIENKLKNLKIVVRKLNSTRWKDAYK